jgi:hypothetical protein
MFALSSYFKDVIIDHVLRNQAYTPPATVYVALFLAGNGLEENEPSSEVIGNGYTRMPVTLVASVDGYTTNDADIVFPDASGGSWGIITYAAIVDHPTNMDWGLNVNVLLQAPLRVAKTIGDGDTFRIPASSLKINLN